MGDKVLLLGLDGGEDAALTELLIALGYEPASAPWHGFSPRGLGRRRPDAIVAEADAAGAERLGELCREARVRWGDGFPVLAISGRSKFLEMAELLDAGASDILPRGFAPALLDRKLSRCLNDTRPSVKEEEAEELPPGLAQIFSRPGLIRLGDLAAIHPGAAPRRPLYRRLAPPDRDWRGVLTGDVMGRFHVGRPESFLKWSRFHLFRLPSPEEYDVEEKVLLRRTGPPLAAAVDRSRLPAGADVYAVTPREGISAGFIACLLNSRLMDFYFNRLAKVSADGRLRPEDIREAPVPRPDADLVQELSRTAALLAHYGPNPEGWGDRQAKDELCERMEDAIFSLYRVGAQIRESLAALHF